MGELGPRAVTRPAFNIFIFRQIFDEFLICLIKNQVFNLFCHCFSDI